METQIDPMALIVNPTVKCPECNAIIDNEKFKKAQIRHSFELHLAKYFREKEPYKSQIKKAAKWLPWVYVIMWLSGILGFALLIWLDPSTVEPGYVKQNLTIVTCLVVLFASMAVAVRLNNLKYRLYKKYVDDYIKEINNLGKSLQN